MSRRFGRNQRRQARAEIARLREAVAMSEGLLAHVRQDRDVLRAEIEEAKDRLAPYCVALPPTMLALGCAPRDRVELPLFKGDPTVFRGPADEPPGGAVFECIPLDVLIASIEEDAMAKAVHVNVQFAGQRVCYAIAREAMYQLAPQSLETEICRSLARQLVRQLRAAALAR